jgi:chemotaxis protein methyltransferase CheR
LPPPDPSAASLPLGTFLLLRGLIRDRLGVWFDEDKRELLASKLSDRIGPSGSASFLDYYFRLKYAADAEDEWPQLADALSVPETYFWREMPQIHALVKQILPDHVAANVAEKRGPVRIWSAACASGEEPLTLAIALQEAGWFERAKIEIWASDFSQSSLDKAAAGIYRERSFRALPAPLRDRYFTPVDGGWRVDPTLHARIRYFRANLLEGNETISAESAAFIFCRNVFIYFSTPTIAEIVGRFAERMPTPGYLFVGVSESLLRVSSAFELEQISDAYVYLKR